MRDHQSLLYASIYGAFVAAEVRDYNRSTGDWPDDERMEQIAEDADAVATQSIEARDRWAASNLARVCPGCHAVAPERCAPGCIDAELAEREEDSDG